MEAVILIGIQASGKSTFYVQRFLHTHVRINLDMLKTRNRERVLLAACLDTQQPFVIDNTNPTAAERARYIAPAKAAGFRVVGYYFESRFQDAIRRNAERPEHLRVPVAGIGGTAKRLQLPALDEGFDAIFSVAIDGAGGFDIEARADDV